MSQPHSNSVHSRGRRGRERRGFLPIYARMFLPVNQRVVGSSPTSGAHLKNPDIVGVFRFREFESKWPMSGALLNRACAGPDEGARPRGQWQRGQHYSGSGQVYFVLQSKVLCATKYREHVMPDFRSWISGARKPNVLDLTVLACLCFAVYSWMFSFYVSDAALAAAGFVIVGSLITIKLVLRRPWSDVRNVVLVIALLFLGAATHDHMMARAMPFLLTLKHTPAGFRWATLRSKNSGYSLTSRSMAPLSGMANI